MGVLVKLFLESDSPACRETREIEASDPDDLVAMAALGWVPKIFPLPRIEAPDVESIIGAKETPTGERWPEGTRPNPDSFERSDARNRQRIFDAAGVCEGNGAPDPDDAGNPDVTNAVAPTPVVTGGNARAASGKWNATMPEGAVPMPTIIRAKLVKPADLNDAGALELSNAGVTRAGPMVGEVTVHESGGNTASRQLPVAVRRQVYGLPVPTTPASDVPEPPANGKILTPCPAHGSGPANVNCSACEAWGKRDQAGEVPDLVAEPVKVSGRLPSERYAALRSRNHPPGAIHLEALLEVLDEQARAQAPACCPACLDLGLRCEPNALMFCDACERGRKLGEHWSKDMSKRVSGVPI